MNSTARKIESVDDWMDLPDGERCELIEGEFVYRTMPSYEHGEFQGRLRAELAKYDRKGGGNGGEPPVGWWFATEFLH